MEGICYLNLFKFHPVSGALESLLKPNHSLYYLYILKYVLVYPIWWSEALLWRPPFFFFSFFFQPAAGLTNQVPIRVSRASTPLFLFFQFLCCTFSAILVTFSPFQYRTHLPFFNPKLPVGQNFTFLPFLFLFALFFGLVRPGTKAKES